MRGGAARGGRSPTDRSDPCPPLAGLLPDAKKPRLLHGTLIMKDSVSALVASGDGGGSHAR